MLLETALHPRTSALCQAQNWRRWAGYIVASSYELTHEREYWAIRDSAALIDVSPLYKYLISGPDAAGLLNRVATRDVSKCKVGQVLYTPWCDQRGKVIDDGTIARLDNQTFRLTAADPSLRWLDDNAYGMKVKIEDISSATAALALQGPHSRDVLKRVSDAPDLDSLPYYHLIHSQVESVPVTISRTGYTGDLGYEIWLDSKNAPKVWDSLIHAGLDYHITPAGMLALDMTRVEAGLLLIEVDYISAHRALIDAQTSTPYELGLGWTVDLKKPNFNGRRELQAEFERGPDWRFVGLEVDWQSLERLYLEVGLPPQMPATMWRESRPAYVRGRQVGYGSSGGWSPLLKKYIALAHLEAPYSVPGTQLMLEFTVEHRRKLAATTVVETPFYNPPHKRAVEGKRTETTIARR